LPRMDKCKGTKIPKKYIFNSHNLFH
jgi:hypothetical protein